MLIPRDAEALFQRGMAYFNLGNFNLAKDDFQAAISYDPFDFDSQLGITLTSAWVRSARLMFRLKSTALPLAGSDDTLAQAYYWIATFLEAATPNLNRDAKLLVQADCSALPKRCLRNGAIHCLRHFEYHPHVHAHSTSDPDANGDTTP